MSTIAILERQIKSLMFRVTMLESMNGQAKIRDEQPHPEPLIEFICGHKGVSLNQVYSKDRHSDISDARNVCMFVLRARLGLTLVHIGNLFNRDHTTALHSMRVVQDKIETITGYAEEISFYIQTPITPLKKVA